MLIVLKPFVGVIVDLQNLGILSRFPEQQLHLIRFPQQKSSEALGLQRKPLAGDAFLKGDETLMPHSYCSNTFRQRVCRPPQGATTTDLVLPLKKKK